jgi:hypothetical protein
MSLRHHKEKLSSILWPFFHSPLPAAEGGQEEGEGEGQAGGAGGQGTGGLGQEVTYRLIHTYSIFVTIFFLIKGLQRLCLIA